MMMFLMMLDSPEEKCKFTEIYEKYHMDVYRMAYSIVKEYHQAQDVSQATFLKIAKQFDKIMSVDLAKRRAYILTMARNEAFNLINMNIETLLIDEVVSETIPDTDKLLEEQIIEFENSIEMCKVLTRLNRSYSEILYLRYYQELDINEIAEMLHLKKSVIYVRLHRAVKALRKIITKEDLGYGSDFEQQS